MRWLAAFGRRLAKTLEVLHASVLQAARMPQRDFSAKDVCPSRREACKEGHVGWQREDCGASKTHVIT